jgi:manganese transport protein
MRPEAPPLPGATATGLSGRTTQAIEGVLAGARRGGVASALLFAGPAVIASIAYVDPGNFATNIAAGAAHGYALLWVVLGASLIAMLMQALSARLGIVTGRNLAELCRDHLPRPTVLAMWAVSEVAAMATDLAEFLGGAIGLSLLAHLPLLAGMAITAVITYAILGIERHGYRPMELVIGALVATIGLCYLAELFLAPVDWRQAARGALLPALPAGSITLAVGIVGATVMPHALFLHSGLVQGRVEPRSAAERAALLRFSNREVAVALGLAGAVNAAMVMMAAAAFHPSHSTITTIETAYATLTPLLGPAAAAIFLVSLLASGISSSVVGTLAGQLVMQGFTGWRVPVWLRRLVTMLPAFAVVAAGIDATRALVLSQVVLSLALPVPMVALVWLTRRADVMGAFRVGRRTQAAATLATGLVLMLNAILVWDTLRDTGG